MTAAVQLRELFPHHSQFQLQTALAESNGQLDAAAEKLLYQTPAGTGSSAASPTLKAQPRTLNSGHFSGTGTPRSGQMNTSWAALRDTQAATPGSGKTASGPVFTRPKTNTSPIAPSLTQQQFPVLGESSLQQYVQDRRQQRVQGTVGQKQQCVHRAAAEPAGEEEVAGEEVSNVTGSGSPPHGSLQTAGDARSQLQQHGTQLLTRRRSLSAQSYVEMTKAAAPRRLEHTARCPSPPPAGWRCSPWTQQSSVSRASVQQSNSPLPLQQTPEQRGMGLLLHVGMKDAAAGGTATMATAAEANCARQQHISTLQYQPQQGCQSAATSQQQSCMQQSNHDHHHNHHHQQQQDQMPEVLPDIVQGNPHQLASGVTQQRLVSTHQQQQQAGDDVYHVMRREAIRLTHRWQKMLKRSAAAAAAGDHSTAKQLGAEARALKLAADEAHAAAAVKIEVANNAHSSAGLWELDLHGLHAQEALTALQERLQLLQDLAQDILQHAQPAAAAQQSSSSRQHLLMQLLLADDAQAVPLHVRQAASRQELRVIVGRGNNSSGGEASLPRVVEQWLGEQKYKFVVRSGALDVKLKRGS